MTTELPSPSSSSSSTPHTAPNTFSIQNMRPRARTRKTEAPLLRHEGPLITNQIGSILKRKRSAGSTEGDGSSCTGGDIDKNNKKKKKIKKQKEKNHHHHHRHQDHCNSGGNHHDDEDKVDGGGGGGTTSSKKAITTPDVKYVQVKASGGGIIIMSTINDKLMNHDDGMIIDDAETTTNDETTTTTRIVSNKSSPSSKTNSPSLSSTSSKKTSSRATTIDKNVSFASVIATDFVTTPATSSSHKKKKKITTEPILKGDGFSDNKVGRSTTATSSSSSSPPPKTKKIKKTAATRPSSISATGVVKAGDKDGATAVLTDTSSDGQGVGSNTSVTAATTTTGAKMKNQEETKASKKTSKKMTRPRQKNGGLGGCGRTVSARTLILQMLRESYYTLGEDTLPRSRVYDKLSKPKNGQHRQTTETLSSSSSSFPVKTIGNNITRLKNEGIIEYIIPSNKSKSYEYIKLTTKGIDFIEPFIASMEAAAAAAATASPNQFNTNVVANDTATTAAARAAEALTSSPPRSLLPMTQQQATKLDTNAEIHVDICSKLEGRQLRIFGFLVDGDMYDKDKIARSMGFIILGGKAKSFMKAVEDMCNAGIVEEIPNSNSIQLTDKCFPFGRMEI